MRTAFSWALSASLRKLWMSFWAALILDHLPVDSLGLSVGSTPKYSVKKMEQSQAVWEALEHMLL